MTSILQNTLAHKTIFLIRMWSTLYWQCIVEREWIRWCSVLKVVTKFVAAHFTHSVGELTNHHIHFEPEGSALPSLRPPLLCPKNTILVVV